MSILRNGIPVASVGPLVLLAALLLARPASSCAQPAPTPLVRLRAEHRIRFEHLATDFRADPSDGLTATALRTLLAFEVGSPALHFVLELEDARVRADHSTPLNTTHVDALEPLSAHLVLSRTGLASSGDQATLRLGRLTLDRGGRRLVARNNFRNTVNAFTGLDLVWTGPSQAVRAFAVFPVDRRPSDQASLADNVAQIDRENTRVLFWGAHLESAVGDGARVEAYVVGLHERDGSVATADRHLVTPGVRLVRPPAPARFDIEVEAMLQVGTSRATAASSDVQDLSHRAFAGHASVGYRFPGPWQPRLLLQYDYASGDRDPSDQRNDRFDPLFGARASELNATGFYGAFARSNINSPGLRIEVAPHARIDVMADYRLYWLASARDAWTTAGLRDVTGDAGAFVGSQLEGRVRTRLAPGVATLDVGGAVLARGSFLREVAGQRDSPAYFYTQLTLTGAWP